ncbi:DNA ligase D [Sphingomonas sp. AOB5]|uniref:DNA ligase D n=1 Tax=Sphingomonas sp. AOB5 TaxID=3034017 RepID=UPI0023F9A6E2|nr:DNA ligase D [Sphingomonas sp. AOB5]MDF7776288.1 DNA ligase D [Sphingomonas sp. AOB5]
MAATGLLDTYNAKRDFSRTKEPKGKLAKKGGNSFVVQKHAATRLHWDFRLEIDGVLKSWAVTKGPSCDPADKRLAVRTEDHPLDYGEFEGNIPKGEYGGGTVMLWDHGSWEPIPGKSADDLKDGHLHFILHGERMKGEWLLVRMKGRPSEKRENWLLRKIDDDAAGTGDTLVERGLTSVLTGRSLAQIEADTAGTQSLQGAKGKAFAQKMQAARTHNARVKGKVKARAAQLPRFVKPQLATLVDDVPTGNNWLHEIKYDGYRALIAVRGDEVKLHTRNGLDWTAKFGPLVDAIAALDLPSALIDGEIVAFDANGNPSFSALQSVLKRGHGEQRADTPFHFFAFDLLSLDGIDLKSLPTIERKERLEALLHHAEPPIHVADHLIGAGEKLYRSLCGAGQEGIIAKRIDAPYRSGRTRAWVKVKCTRRQEFVLVGWTASKAKGRPFASLLLAQQEGKVLVYKGKVGTGFDTATMDELAKAMKPLTVPEAAVEVPRTEARGAHWIKPKLVAEIAFAEFTGDGRVRHGSFLGLRSDKPAKAVKAERPSPAPAPSSSVKISNRDRVIFPDSGQTKGELADYYARIAPLMLPFAANRPISLVRCPQGRAKKCFFQKHDSGAFGESVHHVPIREKGGGSEDYLYVEDGDGLLTCVQMGTIEFHGWASRADAVERPDRMIFDLDPDEGMDFARVRQAAADIRDQLSGLGLVSFAMLSGGKGVHVVVPLTPGHDWETHKDFAARFAQALSTADPDRFVATMSKAKRKGRIFIDWLRNQRGSTAVLPYSARARPGAPVAVPVAWEELETMKDAHPFGIADAALLVERAKALKGWGFAAQTLPAI